MSHLYRVLAVLILFSVQSLANVDLINELSLNAEKGLVTRTKEGKCKVDLLILLDTSKSIGWRFDSYVRPFLKALIDNDQLNVGQNGTQVSLIVFSNEELTKVKFHFGEYTSRDSVQKELAKLKYDKHLETRTYTGVAFEKANSEVFKKKSPKNYRDDADDVLLFITDGEPNGRNNGREKKIAIEEAKKLRGKSQKSVTVIGVSIGTAHKKTVEEITGSALRTITVTEFKGLESKINEMVLKLCPILIAPGGCRGFKCPIIEGMFYAKRIGGKAKVTIPPPIPTSNDKKMIEKCLLNMTGPAALRSYPVGVHELKYTYTFNDGEKLTCPLTLVVKLKCGDMDYDPTKQECCCGQLMNEKKSGHECCGRKYLDTLTHKCCDQKIAMLVPKHESCD